jgi:hypothetical protein
LEGFGHIRLSNGWVKSNCGNEGVECVTAFFCPEEGGVLSEQVGKGTGDVGEVRNEGALIA